MGESFYSEALFYYVRLLNKEINSVLVEEHLFLRHTLRFLLSAQSVSLLASDGQPGVDGPSDLNLPVGG